MKITFQKILFILLLSGIVLRIFPQIESFCSGRQCPQGGVADRMCHHLARDQCRIPTWTLNDCWLNTYRECNKKCSRGSKEMCNCDAYATESCRSSNAPAEACYAGIHQKCMAGMGFAKDPDRG